MTTYELILTLVVILEAIALIALWLVVRPATAKERAIIKRELESVRTAITALTAEDGMLDQHEASLLKHSTHLAEITQKLDAVQEAPPSIQQIRKGRAQL